MCKPSEVRCLSDLDSISGQFWQELAGFSMNFISKIADFELNTRTREKFCYENCFGIFRIFHGILSQISS